MSAPKHLDGQAKAKWRKLSELVDVSQPGNADALAAYCVAYSRWLTAEGKVAELGLIVKSSTGTPVENPYLGIVKRSMVELNRWGRELGIVTKSARQTVKPEAPAAEPDVDLDAQIRLLSLQDSVLQQPAAPPARPTKRQASW